MKDNYLIVRSHYLFFLSVTQKPGMLSSFLLPCLSFVTVGSSVYMQGWGADCISVSWAQPTYKYPARPPNHQCTSVVQSVPSVSGDRTFGLKVFVYILFKYILGVCISYNNNYFSLQVQLSQMKNV